MSPTTLAALVRRLVAEIRQDFPEVASDEDAFAVWCVSFLHQIPLDEAVECAMTGGVAGGNGGIDAVLIDESDGVVYVMQVKYFTDPTTSADAGALGELRSGLSRLYSELYAEKWGGDFANKARTVRSAVAGDADVVLQVVIFGQASAELRAAADSASASKEQGEPRTIEIWDINDLDHEYDDRHTVKDLRGTTVGLSIVGDILPIPEMSVAGLSSYNLAVLDGNSLARAARDYGSRLVDLNVRYQLRKTKINDSIAATATQSSEQAKFLVLNNGLTIICDRILSASAGTIQLENPQIVNGAQTALTIGDNLESIPPGRVQVLARVMEVDRETSLAAEISAATNRQNPVSSADLKAHDPLQIRIESDLLKLDPPWYYERRRNSWSSLSSMQKETYAGCISKEDLAQRFRAFLGEPAKSITAKATIFEQTTLYGTLFDKEIRVERYVLAHQLFDFYSRLLNKTSESLRRALYSDFDEDTRILFMRARNQFAAHATALAGGVLERRYPSMSEERVMAIARACNSGGGDYRPLHKLVVMTLVKWARSAQKAAVATGETFSIKDHFENPAAFGLLLEDAKVTAEFLRDQTLNLLPD